jgi:hypothetical protein
LRNKVLPKYGQLDDLGKDTGVLPEPIRMPRDIVDIGALEPGWCIETGQTRILPKSCQGIFNALKNVACLEKADQRISSEKSWVT